MKTNKYNISINKYLNHNFLSGIIFLYPFLIIIFFLQINTKPILSQQTEKLAIVRIQNISLLSRDSLLFDLYIHKIHESWQYYANGTYHLKLISNEIDFALNPIKIEYLSSSSQLPMAANAGFVLPFNGYNIYNSISIDTIMITVVGARDYYYSKIIPINDSIMIGRFLITPIDKLPENTSFNEVLKWIEPLDYYQATAFKVDKDTLINNIEAHENDNFELDEYCSADRVSYQITDVAPPCFIINNFTADYRGLKKIELNWTTECEAYNRGFIIRRGIMPYGINDPNQVDYNTIIGRWNGNNSQDKELIGLGTKTPGKNYKFYDTVDERNQTYCYKLFYTDFKNIEHDLSETQQNVSACVPIPNSLIVYAQPNPNPFNDRTTIKYKVEDNVRMTITAYEASGKQVQVLMDGEIVSVGEHLIVFAANALSSQGLYEIVFIATPIDDPTVEISRAYVKCQLIR